MTLIVVALLVLWPEADTAEAGNVHIFLRGIPRMAVEAALNGARTRLTRPGCDEVFADFVDRDGRQLSERLRSTGLTGSAYLDSLYFVEADDRRCRADEATAAFTIPGSHVIHVCAVRFAERFALKTTDGELLVIHELLHSLGLGENPPRSSDISATVRHRCASIQ